MEIDRPQSCEFKCKPNLSSNQVTLNEDQLPTVNIKVEVLENDENEEMDMYLSRTAKVIEDASSNNCFRMEDSEVSSNSTDTINASKKSNKEKQREYRARIRSNPVKWMEYLRKENERKKFRKRVKKEISSEASAMEQTLEQEGNSVISNNHIPRHVQLHTCNQCDKSFPHRSTLLKHVLIHSGEKKHQCDICDKRFFRQSDVARHRLIHLGVKDHQCSVCNKRFTLSSNLKQHMMIHLGVKEHQCPVCNKRFSERSYVKKHMLVHSGIRNFPCSVCSKYFARRRDLNLHLLTHARAAEKQ